MSYRSVLIVRSNNSKVDQIFWIDHNNVLSEAHKNKITELIADPIDQSLAINDLSGLNQNYQIIHFNPGVTDNTARSLKSLLNLDSDLSHLISKVYSGFGSQSTELSYNPLVQTKISLDQNFSLRSLTELSLELRLDTRNEVDTFEFAHMSDTQLMDLSQRNAWALSLDELRAIQSHFNLAEVKEQRTLAGLTFAPTDVEIELLAQTWSEHCKHKIFNAQITYQNEGRTEVIGSLFKEFIKAPTYQMAKPWAISVFDDNAGVVRFREGIDLCIKVETHNSPSALDPYGGALTGILGVNRDILGTGLGAKPVANMDVFCVGMPDQANIPRGLKHPQEILAGIHKGVVDGGNKSGIPTVTGAMYFHPSYAGKPLVYCGTVGVMPQAISGQSAQKKGQRPGDLIVMVGGDVGIDGIHGATASSLMMDSETPLGMVQIGDPFTQKRMTDFILAARDQLLFNSITDNGAGGLASSIGEMAQLTGGASVYLERVPLKYSGLKPWQILVSESQERMTLSVPAENFYLLSELADKYSVKISSIGEFTASGFLKCFYKDEAVAALNLKFLHEGVPKLKLTATSPLRRQNIVNSEPFPDHEKLLLALLKNPTIASKEKWVRQYDHEVQGASVVKPFDGLSRVAPNNAGVLWYGAYGVEGDDGFAVASGLCPHYSLFDSRFMAKMAVDEAVRNLICHGADPQRMALVDNFCWPDPTPSARNPDAEIKLGQLVETCKGLKEIIECYQMPLVSGKDSMKNDYYGDGVKISALPTLLITALGHVPNVHHCPHSSAEIGSVLYRVGVRDQKKYLGHFLTQVTAVQSSYEFTFDWQKIRALYDKIFKAQEQLLTSSIHDVSDGGMLVALFETLALHKGGLEFTIPENQDEVAFLYSELPGHFLISVLPEKRSEFESLFEPDEYYFLGPVTSSGKIQFNDLELDLDRLAQAWSGL